MTGLISTKDLMKRVPRYATGDEVIKIPTAAEELGISDVKTPFMEEYGKNIKEASEFAVDHAVGELENQIAQELKSRGYKIEFDWKGFKNWISGKDAQGKIKPMKSAQENRKQFMKFLNKTPVGAVRNMLWRGALKIGKNIASPTIKTIQDYMDEKSSKNLDEIASIFPSLSTKERSAYRGSLSEEELNKVLQKVKMNLPAKEKGARGGYGVIEKDGVKGVVVGGGNVHTRFVPLENAKLVLRTGTHEGEFDFKMLPREHKPRLTPEQVEMYSKKSLPKAQKVLQDVYDAEDKIIAETYLKYKDILPMGLGGKTDSPTVYNKIVEAIEDAGGRRFHGDKTVGRNRIAKFLDRIGLRTQEKKETDPTTKKTIVKEMVEFTGEKKQTAPVTSNLVRSLNLKEFPDIGRVKDFFSSQGINLKDLKELQPDNPQLMNLLEDYRVEAADFLRGNNDFQQYLKEQGHDYRQIVFNKSHLDRSISPVDPSQQFQGLDATNIKILGETVNTVFQPDLEIVLFNKIKDKDVEGVKDTIDIMNEFFIGTKLNDPRRPALKESDYTWLEDNKIIKIPRESLDSGRIIKNTDAVLFGTEIQPNLAQMVGGELGAREYYKNKVKFEKDYGERYTDFMADGGMIQKFAEGTDDRGVEQDTSGVAGLMDEDLNRFIPPHLRFAKNLTGNTVLDFGAEMARYMTPGLGEYLSHEDYKLYSSELAQAFKNKEFLTAAGLSIPTMLAMAGTAIPNHTLVGIPISAAEAVVKKAMKPKLKQLEKPKDIRYKIRDKDGKTVYQTKNKQEAEEHAQRLSGETGEDFIVDEIEFMPKEKIEVMESKPYDIVNDAGQVVTTRRNKNQAEKYLKRHPNENLKMIERNLPDVPRLDPKRLVDVGDNRQFYSKSQQAFDKGFDLATGDATLTAKQWHDYFRSEGVREQELVDSYVRTLLDRKGAFNKKTQTFTSNAPIKASEIKELIDNSPAMHVQSVQFSDAAGNLQYGTSGRLAGSVAGSKRENIIWIDSADIRGDPGLLSDLAKREGTQHDKFYKVKTDKAKFDAGKAKLEGEPYIIGWSLVDTRPGKDAFGKTIKVDLASEIQSDLLQKAATKKAKLKQKISQLGTGSPQEVQKLLQEIDYIFRPMGRTATEIQELVQRLTANQQKFTNASKLELDDVTPALLKDLDNAKIDRDNILNEMFAIVDGISINDLYPNVPLKNSKDWVDTIVKNDVYLAAKNRFTILDDGTIKINKNAPSHYASNSPATVKQHWGSTGEEAGQMYDIIYNNAADSLKRIAKETGSDVQLGKVKQGGSLVEVPMIELVPEMLYSQVQYFKDGGLVQKQYTPLVSIFKPLGVSYGY